MKSEICSFNIFNKKLTTYDINDSNFVVFLIDQHFNVIKGKSRSITYPV